VSKPLTAIGLMSGTSLDGIDVALLVTDGETITKRGPALTVPYSDEHRELLRQAIRDAEKLQDRNARPGNLLKAEQDSTAQHAFALNSFFDRFNIDQAKIDVIGYHGQTVVHRPEIGLTLQLGDGPALAKAVGLPVVFDMRANDMVHGGQGAPLVPVYHRALMAALPQRPVALVNIGGVANVTWIGNDGELLAFDTGPGNALIDDWVKSKTNASRDEGGTLALAGQVDEATVAQFLGDGFFEAQLPKSLDRNSFASIKLDGLSVVGGAATLVAVTTRSIALSQKLMTEAPKLWIICGGGRHNRAIMQGLKTVLGEVQVAEDIGLDGDAVEAEAWAFLAVRSLRGLPLTYPGTTGVRQAMSGGVLAKP
jgi:anhydro-N-acetylmuramic acid kinase